MRTFRNTKTLVALIASFALLVLDQQVFGQWIDQLPYDARESILWSADNEEGTTNDWEFFDYEFPGGGIFNTGTTKDAEAEPSFEDQSTDQGLSPRPHSGLYSVRTTIRNAFQSQNGYRAVRLMRWTDRPWDGGGLYFPNEAYYSTWMYFPENYNPNKYEPWDPGDGGWWTVFQFRAHDDDGVSQPMWSLNVDHNDETDLMEFYLNSNFNTPASYGQEVPVSIPVGQWVHVEAFYRVSALEEGRITVWQDGRQILDVADVRTAASLFDENAIWGIGNYTDHIAGGSLAGSATIYFDDSIVSTRRISAVPPVLGNLQR